ncbi:hypothetical protein MNV49_005603 [Pseudohyphozyma bogoriensis]|nr:hypothetical protein MNV49_005603 [Pseudohyphozyma bogoriensis]
MTSTTIPRLTESSPSFSPTYLVRRVLIALFRLFTEWATGSDIKKQLQHMPEGVTRTRILIPTREPGSTRMIVADRYERSGTSEDERKSKGVHLNFHGSGFVIPSLGTDASFCSYLASTIPTHTIYDVDYRKSPEHPFPAALNDALDATFYLVDPARSNASLSLSGFSAGGNLAMVVSTILPVGLVKTLAAYYPLTDMTDSRKSPIPQSQRHSGVAVPSWVGRFFYSCYRLRDQSKSDPLVSPAFSDVARWPKHVVVVCGDADDLYESARELVERLRSGGVEAEFVGVDKGGHAFDKRVEGKFREETQRRTREDGSGVSKSALSYRMGKVHGSLARAGKVKSQTPKVEPQEKKKKVCGRAKKRIIYNRRFVNVTTQVGGKRRMNPNPEGKSG